MVAGVVAAVLLSGCATSSARDRQGMTERHRSTAGEWHLQFSRDRFAGTTTCRIRTRDGRIALEQGALAFRFGRRTEVSRATHRIDGGPPCALRDDLPRLIRAGVPLDRGGLANPTAGLVWIALERLPDARVVAIQRAPGRPPRLFSLRGLDGILETARAGGCQPARLRRG